MAAIFRLDTSFGGGKTHGLIALVHAARGMKGVPNAAEFIDPALIPRGDVRVAAFDGENADPANGRRMDDGILAYTPWGEIACALAGREGYERVRRSDEQGVAPGAETIAELFGNKPALILLDELSVYLRKIKGRPNARDQLTAFLTSLFKAVESSPRAALVYTLAIGKDGRASDAYSDENQFIADRMAEAESVSARKATLLNPTEDDETVQVLRRRLFERIERPPPHRSLRETSRVQESLAPEPGGPGARGWKAADACRFPEQLSTPSRRAGDLYRQDGDLGQFPARSRDAADPWPHCFPALADPPGRRNRDPPPSCGPGFRAHPAGNRDPRSASPFTSRPCGTTSPGNRASSLWRKKSTRPASEGCRPMPATWRGRCLCIRLPSTTSSRD